MNFEIDPELIEAKKLSREHTEMQLALDLVRCRAQLERLLDERETERIQRGSSMLVVWCMLAAYGALAFSLGLLF